MGRLAFLLIIGAVGSLSARPLSRTVPVFSFAWFTAKRFAVSVRDSACPTITTILQA
jgi:hypothetical protein